MTNDAVISDRVDRYDGIFSWLSNFYPCEIVYQGVRFPSLENAFQAAKFPKDKWYLFQDCTPGRAKRLAKRRDLNTLYDLVIRPDWDDIRVQVMKELLDYKFSYEHNPDLAGRLVSTYPMRLIEGNNWNDHFWGVCNGVGENNLGRLQELRREELMDTLE